MPDLLCLCAVSNQVLLCVIPLDAEQGGSQSLGKTAPSRVASVLGDRGGDPGRDATGGA